MTLGRALLAASIASSLVGCVMLGPDYERPDADLQTDWLKSGEDRLDASQGPAPDWWRTAFADGQLDQLVADALEGNLTLRAAGLRVLQAREQLAIAIGNQYPQVQQALGGAANEKQSGRSDDVYTASLEASWELDFWGRFRRLVESASAALDASVAGYDAVLVSLVSQVAQTYILIRTTQGRIIALEENLKLQQAALDIARAKANAGATTELDADQAETILQNSLADLYQLEIQLQQLKNLLAVLLGRPPQAYNTLLQEPAEVPVVRADAAIGMPQDLIRRRPDIRIAERQMAAQSAQIGVAVTDLYPSFVITGSIGTAASSTGNLFESQSETWFAGGGFQWNLFNYGRLRSNVRLQDAFFQQLLTDYLNTVLAAQSDVENTVIAYLKSHQQLEAYELAAAAAGRAVRISTTQYREGAVGFNTVINTLQANVEQVDLLAISRGVVANNLVQVYRALGGGWELRGSESPVDRLPDEMKEEMRLRTRAWGDSLQ